MKKDLVAAINEVSVKKPEIKTVKEFTAEAKNLIEKQLVPFLLTYATATVGAAVKKDLSLVISEAGFIFINKSRGKNWFRFAAGKCNKK